MVKSGNNYGEVQLGMRHSDRFYSVCIYDPGHYTPYYNSGLCGQLAELGVRCTLITSPPTFEAVTTPGGYDVAFLFFRFLQGRLRGMLRRRSGLRRALKAISYPAGLWRAYRTLRRQQAGVFHIHFSMSPILDALLVRALRRKGWHVVYTLQEPHPEGAWNRWQYGRLMECCNIVAMHSDILAARLREIFPGCEHKISSLTHGTDLPQLPTERERSLARSALGVSPDQPVLLFFGMIKPYKGLEDLLDAMPAVLARAPNVRLCIAGEPLMNMRAVMERIAALQPGTVIPRLGFVPQAEIGRYFASADLVVAPYRKIAASSVVLQALAFGRPVLATRVGALPALLDEGYCGYLAGDNLAEAIVTALADREHLAELGRRGRQRVEKLHSWKNVARETLQLHRAQDRSKRRSEAVTPDARSSSSSTRSSKERPIPNR